ncbi:MAG TPA: hypothetical protein VFH00_10850 [Candidatus Nitrosotalea sp.]|nr:hypothetical protein [Candidatus Nitrosotalea sp.]
MSTSPPPQQVDLSQFASVEDAIEKARASFAGFVPLAKRIMAEDQKRLQLPAIFMLSAIARGTGLCLGVVEAVKAENPHVAFPLLRSYADVVMVVLYVRIRPAYLVTVMKGPRNLPPGTPGRKGSQAMINAVGKVAPGFKAAWGELSDITHFGSLAIWNSWQLKEGPTKLGSVNFATYPRWKNPSDPLLACGWLIELSGALSETLDLMLNEWSPPLWDGVVLDGLPVEPA